MDYMKKVIGIVGLPGSGKSTLAKIISEKGYFIVRTGDVTDEEIIKRGLEFDEANERKVREELRKEHGDGVHAARSLPKMKGKDKIVIDGVYSPGDLRVFKETFNDDFVLAAITSEAERRYARLGSREVRPFTKEESAARDKAQIEKIGIGKVMDGAEVVIENNGSIEELRRKAESLLKL